MIPFVGPSHPLPLDRADLQRAINLYPVYAEDGGEKSEAHMLPTPGLSVWSAETVFATPSLSIDNATGTVVNGQVYTLTVTRSGDLSFGSVVRWEATGDVNAAEGFTRAGGYFGLLEFASGEATKTLSFTLAVTDGIAFAATVTLSNPTNATIVDGTGTLTAGGVFTEFFDNGLTDYSVLSGNGALFTVVDTVLKIASQNSGTQAAIGRTLAAPFVASRLVFDYRVTSLEADDAGSINMGSFAFVPRREASFDALRRGYVLGIETKEVNDGSVDINTWYRADLRFVAGAGNSTVRITKVSDGSLVKLSSLAGNYSSLTFSGLAFIMDVGGVTSATEYDRIIAYP